MITSTSTVHYEIQLPRTVTSQADDWWTEERHPTRDSAYERIVEMAQNYRAQFRTLPYSRKRGWRIVRVETRTDYLETYPDTEAVLGPWLEALEDGEKGNDEG